MSSLRDNLQNLNRQTWPLLIEQMHFLGPEVFHALAFNLIWQLTETARSKRPARRSRSGLDLLWPLVLAKTQKPAADRFPPVILSLWLMAQYFQVWGRFDGWQQWLCTVYTPAQILDELPYVIPVFPNLKPATRQALLAFAIELLGVEPQPEKHLAQLGLLTEAAQTLQLHTQSELLLEEMALLLPTQLEAERPRLAFELGMQWLRHGWGRQARFALQSWQAGFATLEPEDQRWELERCLSHFEIYWADLSGLPLEQTSLLHSWLLRLAEWVLRQEADNLGLLRVLNLALAWGLPEAEIWWQTRVLGLLKAGEKGQDPFYRALLLGYARALDSLSEAQTLLESLPLWPLQCDLAVIQRLHRATWYPSEALESTAQIRLLHLQTLNHLLKHSKGKQKRKLRRQIFEAGAALLDSLRAPYLNRIRQELMELLRLSPKLLKNPHAWAHQELRQHLLSAQHLGGFWARAQDILYHGGESLRDWIDGILAYPPAELAQTELALCLEIYASLPAGWPRWQITLGLAEGLLAHWPWEKVLPYWQACFDWSELDGYEPLQAFSSLALALSRAPLPDKPLWFEKLAGGIAVIDPQWQADTWIALGHCQIRAGLLATGLQTLASIRDPEAALQGLLQVGSVLTEIKQNNQYPALIDAILACLERQAVPELKWYGYLTAASALALRGKSAQGQATFHAGVALFLP
ncbi:MAG: hypothetical protein AB7I41_21910 [Candidatus Sericytochromatia bacterium]